jgi:hypothetical protein
LVARLERYPSDQAAESAAQGRSRSSETLECVSHRDVSETGERALGIACRTLLTTE